MVPDDGDRSTPSQRRTDPPETGVGTLDRTLDVLDAVEGGARSFTDVVRATGLTRSTAHRLIRALEAHGLLMHVGGHGYALGTRLLRLADSAAKNLPLRDLAHPSLERLARATGESAQLYVRDGDVRLCVDSVESASELRTIVHVGSALPLTRGSAGKVFLAWANATGRRQHHRRPATRRAGPAPPPDRHRPTARVGGLDRRTRGRGRLGERSRLR